MTPELLEPLTAAMVLSRSSNTTYVTAQR
eukprot:COSAG06_NODE_56558_length_284_cov_0.816216_1_plen_28_part_10